MATSALASSALADSAPLITALHVRVVNPPLATPHATAGGVVASFPMVLLDLATNAGVVGHSYVFTYSMLFAPAVARLLADLAPLVVRQPCAPLALQAIFNKRLRLIGPHGFTAMAAAALDMAAWDVHCKQLRLPLYRVLGGVCQGTPGYAPVGLSGVDGAQREAAAGLAVGLGSAKAKIGYATVQEDLAVVQALKAALPGGQVMVDYNQTLNVGAAISRGHLLDGEGLGWIEEPVTAEDFSGHAQVAAALRTPVQAGENWWGPLEFRKAIAARATDLLMPDVMKLGGITAWLKVAALAEAHGLPVSSHLFPEVSAHLLACTPTAHWLEWTDWSAPIVATPVQVRNGCVWPSDEPGIGLVWVEAAVKRWLVS
jgi:mandelate racemase